MHYMRRRFQKGKGMTNVQAQGTLDLVGAPMFALMALAGHLQHKMAKSKKKINIKTKRTTRNKRHDESPGTD